MFLIWLIIQYYQVHILFFLTVDGNINSVPNFKFAYLTNITSDVQTQINNKANTTDLTTINTNISTLQNKTVDISYDSLTLTTSHINNLP